MEADTTLTLSATECYINHSYFRMNLFTNRPLDFLNYIILFYRRQV